MGGTVSNLLVWGPFVIAKAGSSANLQLRFTNLEAEVVSGESQILAMLNGSAGGSNMEPGGLPSALLPVANIIPPVQITTTSLPAGMVGSPYSQSLTASGGSPPYLWSVTGGTLPPGLTFNSTAATIQGTPQEAGTFALSIMVMDSQTGSATRSFSISITAPPVISIVPNQLTFAYQSGGTLPSAQQVTVSSGAMFALTATSSEKWLLVSPTGASTPANFTVSISGNVTSMAPGVYPAAITITAAGATNSPQMVSVTLTVTPAPELTVSQKALTFSYQTGGLVPSAQSIAVGSNGSAMSFQAATMTNSGVGWLSVSPASGMTPANVNVSVTPSSLGPGGYTGTVTFTGTGGVSALINVTLSIIGPTPTISAVVNAASGLPGAVAPGEIVTIAGEFLGPSAPAYLTVEKNGKVSESLGSVQVVFGTFAAPLTYVSSTQINAVVPYEIAGLQTVSLEIQYQGQLSKVFPLTTAAAVPALFTSNSSGTGPVAALNQDGTYNAPNNPAAKGTYVVLYMTGEGQTAPPGVTGQVTTESATPPLTPQPILPVTVVVTGQPAFVSFYGEAPGLVAGVMQLNVQVPMDVASGNVPISVSVGDGSSPAGVTISVQ